MNVGDYPVPAHAAYIWLAGDTIYLGLPSLTGSEKGHTIHAQANPTGLLALLSILRSRASGQSKGVGTKADPTQYNLEAVLASLRTRSDLDHEDRVKAKAEATKEADELLKELGL